jgi:hypothetical protein
MSFLGGNVPIGGVIGWVKSYSSTPQRLNESYVECNGQTLSDVQSPYNGQVLPDLNVAAQRFLRGSSTSGSTGGSETHTHVISASSISVDSNIQNVNALSSLNSPSTATSTLPTYYELVWVMRVK